MATKLILNPKNDQQVFITGVSQIDTSGNSTPLTGAAITGVLVDPSGSPVAGASSISFTDVSGTPGSYVGQIVGTSFNPATLGGGYTLQCTGSKSGLNFYFEVACSVQVRKV